jgi:hypothetical protein
MVVEVVEVVDVEVDEEDVVGADVVVESADSLGLQAATSKASVTSLATVVRIGGSLRSARQLAGINRNQSERAPPTTSR